MATERNKNTLFGFLVGVNLPPEQQIAPLLFSIRKKILNWSSTKLSLAGQVVIVNHVLLSTLWYVLFCWIFSKSSITQIQRAIRRVLWLGIGEGIARSKLAWSTLILPTSRGGLGKVDLQMQSKEMLAKLVVRCLQPRKEIWKALMRRSISQCSLVIGKPWELDIRWIFYRDWQYRSSHKWEDRFIRVIHSWKSLQEGLVQTN